MNGKVEKVTKISSPVSAKAKLGPLWERSSTKASDFWKEARSHISRRTSQTSQTIDLSDELACPYSEPETLQAGSSFTITEDTKFRKIWSLLLAVMLIYVATLLPFKLVFREFRVPKASDDTLSWAIATWIVDICFWIDLIVNFFLSYRDRHGREVTNLPMIWKRYLKTGFGVDLISCLPPQAFEAMLSAFSVKSNDASVNKIGRMTKLKQLPKLTKIIRVLRLAKIFTFFKDSDLWRKMQEIKGIKEVTFIIGFLIVAHLMACGWYLVASLHGSDVSRTWIYRRDATDDVDFLDASPVTQWLHSWYFVITVFTSVGFGDIGACSTAEVVYVILTMIVGTITSSIILAQILNVMQTSDNLAVQRDEQLGLIKSFAEHTQLAPQTAAKFRSFIKKTSSVHREYDRERVKLLMSRSVFPRELEGELPRALFRGELLRNRMLRVAGLKHMPATLPLYIALSVHQRFMVKGDLVYCCGDLPSGIHLVLNGIFAGISVRKGSSTLSLSTETDSPTMEDLAAKRSKMSHRISECAPNDFFIYQIFCRRNYFGDAEVLFNYPARRTTIRCESDGAMLVFDKHDLIELNVEFPLYVKALRNVVRRRHFASAILFKANKRLFHRVEDVAAYSIQRAFKQFCKSRERANYPTNLSLLETVNQLQTSMKARVHVEAVEEDATQYGAERLGKLESQMHSMSQDMRRLEGHVCKLTSLLERHLDTGPARTPNAQLSSIERVVVL